MKNFTTESLGDLEKGIKQLLLEDRYSFSVNDRALLNDCLKLISSTAAGSNSCSNFSVDSLARLVELVLKLLIASDHIKHLF